MTLFGSNKKSTTDTARKAAGASGTRIQPEALMRIRNMELRAQGVVEGFRHGMHRSPYHGFSVEFTEYRQYVAGDDPRNLDWRVYGRSDRYYIRKFEDETNLRCHLLLDCSRSMSYGTLGYSKADYAATLAATLAYFLQIQGDATGLMTFDQEIRDYLPARHRPGHLRQLMLALERAPEGTPTDLVSPLKRVMEILKKRGLLVVISDFLAPIEGLQAGLRTLQASGHEVIAFQILDPGERTLPWTEPGLIEDLESGRTLRIEPATIQAMYQERLKAHQDQIQDLCLYLGVRFHSLTTDQPLELALFQFLQDRQRRTGRRRPGRASVSTTAP
jgi:uncharacterized protein (DUF58 family)